MFNGSIYVGEGRTPHRHKHLPPEVLTDDEVTKLMRACSHRAPTGIRNRALIALLYRSGLRIAEALSLYPKDLELDKGIIRVLNGKGGKSRTVGIDPGAAAIVQRWLDVRSSIDLNPNGKSQRSVAQTQLDVESCANPTRMAVRQRNSHSAPCDVQRGFNGRDPAICKLDSQPTRPSVPVPLRRMPTRAPVFCTLDGQPMSASYVRVMLKRLAFKAGIDKRVHAHGFRHTHAAQLRTEGVDIAIISRQLGHSRIDVTARYLDHIAPAAVIETMRSRKWSGG